MDKWQVVFPWCKYLRGRLAIEEREYEGTLLKSHWWLLVSMPKTRRSAGGGHLQRMREALELLSLVASCDDGAWKQLLRDKCGVHFDTREHIKQDEPLVPRFIFVMDDHTKETVMWPTTLCSKFFFQMGTKNERNQDYVHARAQVVETIARLARGTKRSNVHLKIPFCLYFSPRAMDPIAFSTYLHSVLRLVHSLASKPHDHHATSAMNKNDLELVTPFELDAIQLPLTEFEITESVARVLTEMFSLGVKISCLQLPLKATDFIADEECPRQALGACLVAAVGGRATYFDDTENGAIANTYRSNVHRNEVEAIVINDPSVDDRRFAAFCSALVESTCVKELTLESVFLHDGPRARSLKWKWLAYALFSAESRSSVRKLVIMEASLQAEDVEAIAGVISAAFPAKELLDPLWSIEDQLLDAHRDDAHTVHLERETVICLEPVCCEAEWLSASIVLQEDACFHVMNNNPASEWVEILVPGHGKCWVHRHFAFKTQTREEYPVGDRANQVGKISTLVLALDRIEDNQGQVVASLFRLIGANLVSLTIQTNRLHSDCLGSILRSCPNLKTLSLKGAQVDSMDVLKDAYEQHQCRLSSISLKDFRIDVQSFTRFAYALADRTHPAAMHLRELCFGSAARHHPFDEDNMLAFLAMLERNSTLEYLELHIDSFLFGIYAPAMLHHHNKLLTSTGEKLFPLTHKLAFLSVLREEGCKTDTRNTNNEDDDDTESSSSSSSSFSSSLFPSPESPEPIDKERKQMSPHRRTSLPRLDSNALRLIFAFAATRATRLVCLVEY